MPNTRVNGIELYYETHGSGEPLLFICGLGGHLGEIPYLIDSYSAALRVHRVRWTRLRPQRQARAGVLDRRLRRRRRGACWTRSASTSASVYGSSMGGMVAQELTLRHPRAGAGADPRLHDGAARSRGVPPSIETIQKMARNQTLSGDEALEAGWELGYSRAYIDANREAMFARCRIAAQNAAPRDSYMRQVMAAAKHDTCDRLHLISAR